MVPQPRIVESLAVPKSVERHAYPSSYSGNASQYDIGAIYALSRDDANVLVIVTACAPMTEASHVVLEEIEALVKVEVHIDVMLILVIISTWCTRTIIFSWHPK